MRTANAVAHRPQSAADEISASRLLDLVVAIPALALAAPVLALAVVAIRLDSTGPAVFVQPRTGRDRREFDILKLRTMFIDNDDSIQRQQNMLELANDVDRLQGVAFKDQLDPRITRVGRRLRRFSLDELPQLINVIKGEMSIVGPRPSLPWEAELFPASVEDRFAVLPGITGVWQVSGRNDVSMPEMLEMDCEYARQKSVVGDLKLMLRTIPAVLSSKGAA